MTLQWLARLSVDTYDNAVRVTWKIDAHINCDFAQLVFDFLFFFWFAFFDKWSEFTRNPSNFVKKGKFTFIKITIFIRKTFNKGRQKSIKNRFEWIRLWTVSMTGARNDK